MTSQTTFSAANRPSFGLTRPVPPQLLADAATARDWIEATMRRHETPATVDVVKRPGTIERLARMLSA